ncbi:MAG: diguanylate cyclase [Candidatus Omnitrophica bacterium]|nr:diguanylate cyclase [Candidatus Omnitrophota bacterium]
MVSRERFARIFYFIFEKGAKYKIVAHLLFGILVGTFITHLYNSHILQRLELITLDSRFRLRPSISASTRIIHIDMSEDSIQAIGRWPWPRNWHAAITSMFSEYKPRMIIYDVIFSEEGAPENDAVFSESIRQAGDVYLGLTYNTGESSSKDFYRGGGIKSVLEPLKIFKDVVKGVGHLNVMPDPDGTIRRIPPIIEYENKRTFHISVKSSLDLLGIKEKDINFNPDRNLVTLKMAQDEIIKVPLDRNNQLIINWVARWGKAFRHFSYIDVIKSYKAIQENRIPIIDLNIFRDKILLIGLTASGLIDIKPTPIQNAYPAVGANAAVINSFLNRDFIKIPTKKEEILLIYLISIFVSLLLFRVRPINGMILTALIVIVYLTLSVLTFNVYNTWITIIYPVAAILLSYGFIALYTQIAAAIERNRLFSEATRDGLTNLYNIRHFNLLLEAEFKNLKLIKSKKTSIIMSDIDNFKKINDTYGHQVGDVILRDTAKIFQSNCRQIDIVARYGGEEFIILLPGAGKEEAVDVAERIRQGVENKKFKFKDKHYTATISFGVNEYTNEENKEDIIRKADGALYRAKTTGKNKVVAV